MSCGLAPRINDNDTTKKEVISKSALLIGIRMIPPLYEHDWSAGKSVSHYLKKIKKDNYFAIRLSLQHLSGSQLRDRL
jgi:hypothetical protein